MSEAIPADLRTTLQEILSQLANLSERVTRVEKSIAVSREAAPAALGTEAETPAAVRDGISEEELLAISAALAAWLGVRAHIRQVRLIRTGVWAQEGRVTIQASHSLHY
jgi:methylmalonyl-CoA carboxyltransferase large subunit